MAFLRLAVILHLIAVAAQAVLAGQFLAGSDASVAIHERAGLAVALLALLQIALAVILKQPRANLLPFLLSSILILLADGLQIGTGYGRFLSVHIPLGAMILGALAAQTVWVFR